MVRSMPGDIPPTGEDPHGVGVDQLLADVGCQEPHRHEWTLPGQTPFLALGRQPGIGSHRYGSNDSDHAVPRHLPRDAVAGVCEFA